MSGAAPHSAFGSLPFAAPGRNAGVCAVILAAGEGRRLRPLTEHLPKALCPVGNVALLDRALARVAALGLAGPRDVAVNASYLADQVVRHVAGRAHLSVEANGPLGTSGGVGKLRGWIDGRGVLVGNADSYLADPRRDPGKDIAALLDGWDGLTVRMLTRPTGHGQRPEFSKRRFAGFSLLPWRLVEQLTAEPDDLVRTVWRPAEADGKLQLVAYEGAFLDTGTPADYLAANMHAAAGAVLLADGATVTGRCANSVVGAGASVRGAVTRCVIWPGGSVSEHEFLVDAVRVGADLTVHCG
jgi:NDP-sugar pyrophosphorylase family protein